MSVFSLEYSKNNPVTLEVLDNICSSLGVTLKDEEKADYHRLLAVYHDSTEKLMAMDDYIPPVDLTRFPRKNVHLVAGEDNPLGAWAWKCEIQDENYKSGSGGLLEGKTIAIKDCIAIKDVPFLMGTEFFQDYTPVGA
jgi:amidase